MKNWNGILLSGLLVILFLVLPEFSWAQNVSTQVTKVKGWVVTVARMIFVIIMVIGALKTVKEFISGNPKAWTNLVYLIVAAMVYYGLSAILSDMSGLGDINTISG